MHELSSKSLEQLTSKNIEMPSFEMPSANKLNVPKHLCIRLATGPQYHS